MTPSQRAALRELAKACTPMNCDAFPDDDQDVPRFEVDPETVTALLDYIDALEEKVTER